MALQDQLESIRNQSLHRLNEAHDYFTNTKGAWLTLQQVTEQHALQFTIRNLSTGSITDQKTLLARAEDYISDYLVSATLQQFVSLFESFLSQVLSVWLVAYPVSLGKRQLMAREILALPDKGAIVDALVEKELRELFYGKPADWFSYLNDHVSIGIPTTTDAEQFAEIKATRDVIVHGQGLANAYYVAKAGSRARASIGQPLKVSESYHQSSWELIGRLIADIGTAMAAKAG